jgi:hypothetical protein
MLELKHDLTLALDRVAFAREIGIEPDPWQAELLRTSSRQVLLNCSRQSGKSQMAAILALHQALYHPDSLVLVMAPALRQSQELFAKVTACYRTLGRPVPAPGDRKLALELENGSRIITLPGSERTVRGFSGASLLLLDEASRIEDGLYHAVRPMLAVSGGRLIMLSTPYGKRGVFHSSWTGGDSGGPNGWAWKRFEVPAAQVPRISPEFLAEERAALPDFVFRQEYECSFEETEDQVFSTDIVDRAITTEVKPLFGDDGW